MSKIPFNPEKHYSDSLIVKLSMKYPIQYKFDRVYGVQWRFRTTSANDLKTDEAVVMIPGTYETCTSYIYMLDKLVSLGYRAVIIDFGEYPKFKQIAKAFDQFCDGLGVNKAHIIGDDMGGFMALQIASHPKIGTKILSISLINAFTSLSVLKRPNILFSVFGQLSARSLLKKEIEEFHSPQGYTSEIFIQKEIETELPDVLDARLKLRNAKTMTINPRCDPSAIMSIETLDKFFLFDEEYIPSIALKGCRQALMKWGGEWPHIQNPDDTIEYITAHLRKWGKLPKNLEEAQEEANKEQEALHKEEENFDQGKNEIEDVQLMQIPTDTKLNELETSVNNQIDEHEKQNSIETEQSNTKEIKDDTPQEKENSLEGESTIKEVNDSIQEENDDEQAHKEDKHQVKPINDEEEHVNQHEDPEE